MNEGVMYVLGRRSCTEVPIELRFLLFMRLTSAFLLAISMDCWEMDLGKTVVTNCPELRRKRLFVIRNGIVERERVVDVYEE